MMVKFVKEIYQDHPKAERMVKDPTSCPFCNKEMIQTFPGDMCDCGAIVYGIYGDKVLK